MEAIIYRGQTKNSNLDWVGEIPSHWETISNKYVMHKEKRICEKWEGQDVMSLTMNGVVIRDLTNPTGKMPTTFDGYQYVYNGELLMCLFDIDVTPRCVGRVFHNGVTSPAYSCFKLHSNADLGYYYYYYLMIDHTKALLHQAKNIRHSFTEEQLGMLKVPFPPIEEQILIGRFLDEQCKKIDHLIAETKESIDEYKKWKESIIDTVTTNGLRKNTCFKKSGIEWIESIPENWCVARLKNKFSFGKGLPITKENLSETGVPVISYGQIHAKFNTGTKISNELIRYVPDKYLQSHPECLVKKHDILIADTSEDLEGCGNCVYVDRNGDLFAGYHTIILRSIENRDNKYLAYLFKSNLWRSQIRTRVSGVKLFSISKKILNTTSVILPPEDEQKEIVSYLDKKCSLIDSVINEKCGLISELEIYKKSLIYEVVTGKRKVV